MASRRSFLYGTQLVTIRLGGSVNNFGFQFSDTPMVSGGGVALWRPFQL